MEESATAGQPNRSSIGTPGLAVRLRSALGSERGRRLLAFAIFALAALISVLVLGFAGRGQTLKGDEWGYVHRFATQPFLHVVFVTPPGKYLLVLPMILYKLAFATIGISDYLPYRMAAVALTIATAFLFLLLAARRVGYLVALLGAVLILFLGSASEVTATAIRIPEQIAAVAGLGALLALERSGFRRDVVACVLLVISVTSHPLGLGFATAGAVVVLARPGKERWRRAWIFAIPLLLFAIWYLIGHEPAPDNLSLGHQLGDVPRFEFQSLTAMTAAVTGAFRAPFSGDVEPLRPVTYALAMLVFVAVGVRALSVRMRPMFWALLAGIGVLFAAPAFAPGALREPDASRYVFAGAILLMLLVCEAFQGATIRRRDLRIAGMGALAAVFGFAVYSNATVLDQSAGVWANRGLQVRSELTALDLAADRVAPQFQPENPSLRPPIPYTHTGITAQQYFVTADAYGSPAFSPAELRGQAPADKRVTDVVLAHALNLQLRPVPAIPASSESVRPSVVTTDAKVHNSAPGCVTIDPGDTAASTQLQLPRGGGAVSASGPSRVPLALGRFSPGYGYPLGSLGPGRAALIPIPPDSDQTPWRLLVGPSKDAVRVCGLDLSSLLKQ